MSSKKSITKYVLKLILTINFFNTYKREIKS